MSLIELVIDGENAPFERALTEEELAALPAPIVVRIQLPKSTVTARLIAMGKAAAVKAALDAAPALYFQWFSPDWPNVYADDQGLLDFLRGPLALTEEQVAAVIAA